MPAVHPPCTQLPPLSHAHTSLPTHKHLHTPSSRSHLPASLPTCVPAYTQLHELMVKFAVPEVGAGAMSLSYTPCDGSAPERALSTGTLITNPLVWDPTAAASNFGTAAYIGGMQCDAYRTARGQPTFGIDSSTQTPLYRRRLPWCRGRRDETLDGTCSWGFNFRMVVSS